jgi:S-DNA-T family DNA segregation ATPase FtsK/SpoIIIE
MLFLWPGTSTLLRGQGTYLSGEEINAIVDCCSRGEQNFVQELVNIKVKDPEADEDDPKPAGLQKRDELYEQAVDMVVREGRGSVSLLQRALGIGYGRAARLIDFMAEDGIVGQYNGSQAREILITLADWERMQGGAAEEEEETPSAAIAKAPPKKRNKVTPEPWADDAAAEPDEAAAEVDNDEGAAMGDDGADESEEDHQAESA